MSSGKPREGCCVGCCVAFFYLLGMLLVVLGIGSMVMIVQYPEEVLYLAIGGASGIILGLVFVSLSATMCRRPIRRRKIVQADYLRDINGNKDSLAFVDTRASNPLLAPPVRYTLRPAEQPDGSSVLDNSMVSNSPALSVNNRSQASTMERNKLSGKNAPSSISDFSMSFGGYSAPRSETPNNTLVVDSVESPTRVQVLPMGGVMTPKRQIQTVAREQQQQRQDSAKKSPPVGGVLVTPPVPQPKPRSVTPSAQPQQPARTYLKKQNNIVMSLPPVIKQKQQNGNQHEMMFDDHPRIRSSVSYNDILCEEPKRVGIEVLRRREARSQEDLLASTPSDDDRKPSVSSESPRSESHDNSFDIDKFNTCGLPPPVRTSATPTKPPLKPKPPSSFIAASIYSQAAFYSQPAHHNISFTSTASTRDDNLSNSRDLLETQI